MDRAAAALAWLEGLSRARALAVSIVLLILVAAVDELTGADVSFTLLYLCPIAFGTWFVSLPVGVVLSVASAMASAGADLATRTVPLASGVQLWNLTVQLGVFLAQVVLLGALKGRLQAEGQLARTDPLTRIANRRAFLEQAQLELERSRRTRRPLTVAYLDCDDFKLINDRLGHAQGDELLVAAAATLRASTRVIDSVARLGGDEFGLLLAGTDAPTAEGLVERLRAALAAAMAQRGWPVSFSIGAATFVDPPRSVDEMLARADQLMYAAKSAGKNTARLEVVGRPELVPVTSATPLPAKVA